MEKITVDLKLVKEAKELSEEALEKLFSQFRPLIKSMAVKYFLTGSDREDVIQEAMIALFGAVRSFNAEKNGDFYGFAKKCIELRLKSAVKMSLRKKHTPLNRSVSIEEKPEISEAVSYTDPEEEYINNESYILANEKLKSVLSIYELSVVSLLMAGMKPSEIATALNKSPKSVDNAMQRIRKKAAELFNREQ